MASQLNAYIAGAVSVLASAYCGYFIVTLLWLERSDSTTINMDTAPISAQHSWVLPDGGGAAVCRSAESVRFSLVLSFFHFRQFANVLTIAYLKGLARQRCRQVV